ncbi:MAG: phosphatidate cytidylyltransferase [Kiritimatiellae bacterium]|nr:phosphatidate cytidylyltransferase [Kiritimatiellia bacterium]
MKRSKWLRMSNTPGELSTVKAGERKTTVFFRRLASFVVLWGMLIGVLFSPNKYVSTGCLLVMVAAFSGVGLLEFYCLVERAGWPCYRRLGILGGVSFVVCTNLLSSGILGGESPTCSTIDVEMGLLVILVLGLCLRQFSSRDNQPGLVAISTTIFGLMYVPWLLNFVQKIIFYPGKNGPLYFIYFIAITKLSDPGAYVVGSLIGRHKLSPRISPGKTWEGVAGAIAVSLLTRLVFKACADHKLTGLTWNSAVVLGLLLGAAAVVGDLVESLFKRQANAKDSGNYIPGIGGALDLLDSILFNAPIMYLYMRYILS